MNKVWLAILVNMLGVVSPAVVYAQQKNVRPSNASQAAIIRKEVAQATTLDRLKTKAYAEIDRRLMALSKISDKINATDRLTAEQKSTILSQIQTTVSNLTALRTKIGADTDMATLRTDVQSIARNYQMYSLVLPKAELLGAVNAVLAATDRMTEISGKLQTRIEEAKAAGKDVAALEATYADMISNIADAKQQSQVAMDAILSVSGEVNPERKAALESARSALKTARQDLVTARQDAQTIITGLR